MGATRKGGSPAACGLLGERLRDGRGVGKNAKLATAFLTKACSDGDSQSCRTLGKSVPSLADLLAKKADANDAACGRATTPACEAAVRTAVERQVVDDPDNLPACDEPHVIVSGGCRVPTCEELGGHIVNETTLDACRYHHGDHAGQIERYWGEHEWCDGMTKRECPNGCGVCPLDSDTPIEEPTSPAWTEAQTAARTQVDDFEQKVERQESKAPACRDDNPCCQAWDKINASGGALGLKKVPAC